MKPLLAAASIALAACGQAAAPADKPPPGAAPPPAPCFGDPDDQELVPPLAEDAAPTRVGYRDGSTSHGDTYWYCDLPDRIVMVDGARDGNAWTGEVVSISRATPAAVTRALIAKDSSCTDACDVPGGAFAGCSEQTTCMLRTTVPGASPVVTGLPSPRPFGVIRSASGQSCAPGEEDDVIAICSTATRTVEVRVGRCAAPRLYHLAAHVYEGNAPRAGPPSRIITGGLPAGDSSSWTYRFDAPATTLVFHLGASPSAALTLEGQPEDCLAFGLGPP